MQYCDSPLVYRRRLTREVVVGDPARGGVVIGGRHPIVVQSMLTCDTMDTAECVKQTLELVAVGCQIVRITAPTVKDAANLKNIIADLRRRGCQVPIVADIHFKPEAALEAAQWVEMVSSTPEITPIQRNLRLRNIRTNNTRQNWGELRKNSPR